MTAEYKVHASVAVITLNNPPVNGLGLSPRRAILEGLNQANADAAVQAIVITGAGKAFSGGADIKEFGKEAALQEPNLHTVIAQVEQSAKPVVAAIHSVCMGGGRWRWAVTTALRRQARPWRCPRSSWVCCLGLAARSACPAPLVWNPR